MMNEAFDDLCMGCMSVNSTRSICPHCGFDIGQNRSLLVLPYRTLLKQKFLIGRVLGKGGFGITYLAWDLILQTAVAIKEYMPSSLVARDADLITVVPHSGEDGNEFEYGLKQFLLEARTLAQFSHTNVVRVREFFSEHNTAYLVMDYYQGISLEAFLQQHQRKVSEEQALKIMLPVLNGLLQVHQKGFLHRDVKPANIYLVDRERPVLLDFGAARSALGQKSLSLSVVLTPGFAPFEQYLSRANFTPSTDIYAVAATLYYMVSGIKPHEATARLKNDPIIPLATLEPTLSRPFARAVMLALAVYPEQRPQTVEAFQEQLTDGRHRTSEAKNHDNVVNSKPQKYSHYYCPHCKTKNIIREGKSLVDVKCIKCRKAPSDKVKEELSLAALFKFGLLLFLLFIGYRLIGKEFLVEKAIPSAPLAVEAPKPIVTVKKAPEQEEDAEADRQMMPESVPVLDASASSLPAEEPPLPAEEPPLPADDAQSHGHQPPHPPPQFAVDACVDRAIQESCMARTPRRQLPGRCESVRGVLACIPDDFHKQ